VTRNGWAGYDPYDLRQLLLRVAPRSKLVQTALRRATLLSEWFFPMVPRRLLRVPKQVNAKAMGLFAAGYQILYEATGEEGYLDRAQEALTWLEENACEGCMGLCWGHPFDWQSRMFIPRATPSSVVSAIAGDAFWRFYQMTGCRRYLASCQSVCDFFVNDLNVDELGEDAICFSKTPLDHFHIHNGNLFVADFLLKVGKALPREDYVRMAWKALTYTLGEQRTDGSICYWGRDQDEGCKIDHYHTGFEIRCLYSIWKSTGDERVHSALKDYYRFYCEKLFTSQAIPKMTPRSLYPVNIHSCAEAILCHSTVAADFPEAQRYLRQCVPWVIKTMQHPEGWFIYAIRNIAGSAQWKVKIPYIRWGQAWMLRALAQYYSLLSADAVSSEAGEEEQH
jgi:rhamnogalacturonyl hydrolase YesR